MARLQSYTQQQLASSVVGVPGVDRSGEILAGALQKVAGDFANFQIQNLQRRTKAEDSLAINAISESRDIAKLEMQQFMVDNPDPSTWENGWDIVIQKQQKEFIGKTLTRNAAANARINQKAFELGGRKIVQILATEQTINIDIDTSGENLIKTVSDPLATEPIIAAAKTKYSDALLRKMTKEEANIRVEETFREATIEKYDSQASLFPEETINLMTAKKKAIGKGGVDTDGLDANDYDNIIGTALTIQSRNKKVLDDTANENKLALYKKEDNAKAMKDSFEGGEITILEYKEGIELNTLTRDDFNAAYRDADEADLRYDEYVNGLKAEAKGEVNFIKKGDPIILAKTEAVIDLKPTAITEKEIHKRATQGIGTENVSGLVDRLREAKKGIVNKFNSQFSILYNTEYFGEKDEPETGVRYLRMRKVMGEFLKTQKPTEALADKFFEGLITKNFKGFRRGGWEEKGFKHTFTDEEGNKITQRFRFGDIRTRKKDDKIIEEFYAGTDDNGDALWLPRR